MLPFLGLAGVLLYAGYKYLSKEDKEKIEELMKKRKHEVGDLELIKVIKEKIKSFETVENKKEEKPFDLTCRFLTQEEIDRLLNYAEEKDNKNEERNTSFDVNKFIQIMKERSASTESLIKKEKEEIKEDLSLLKKEAKTNIEESISEINSFFSKIKETISNTDLNASVEDNLKKVSEMLEKTNKEVEKEENKIYLESLYEERTAYQKELARGHELMLLNSRLTVSGDLKPTALSINGMTIEEFLKKTEEKLNDCTRRINELQKK